MIQLPKLTRKDIFWILKVGGITIALVIGLGIISAIMTITFGLMYQANLISDEQFNLIVYSQTGISLGIVVYWIIRCATPKKCPNCKEILN